MFAPVFVPPGGPPLADERCLHSCPESSIPDLLFGERSSNESGVTLVMLAIGLAVLIGAIGLAVDLNMGLSINTEQQQLADALAYGAIDSYLDDTFADPDEQTVENHRLASASARVQELVQLPTNSSAFQSFLADPDAGLNLCLASSPAATCGAATNVLLVPGYWHNEQPASEDPCGGEYPCFEPGSVGDRDFTAFHAELTLSRVSPMRTIFWKLLGQQSLRTTAAGTAAALPRHIVLAVDLSPSVEGTTHLHNLVAGEHAISAFKLDPRISCNNDHTVSIDPCDSSFGSTCEGIVHSGLSGPYRHNLVWQGLPGSLYAAGAPYPTRASVTQHFKNDYQCWTVDFDGVSANASYLIDTYQNLNPGPTEVFYEGPQPLTSILRAIHYSLNVMSVRRNAGDRIQLSFFDNRYFPEREIPYFNGASNFRLAHVKDGDTDFDTIKLLTDVDDPASLAERIARHAIFPRVEPLTRQADFSNPNNPVAQQGGVFTDIERAATRARDVFDANGSANARKIVVMFSDFLNNCRGSYYCTDDRAQIWSGLTDLGHGLENIFSPKNISFNPILMGSYSLPHTTVALDGAGGGCMWDENMIRTKSPSPIDNYGKGSRVNWTQGCLTSADKCLDDQRCGAGDVNPADCDDPTPNIFYEPALATGGTWGVIRPCCKKNGGCENVQSELNNYCAHMDKKLSKIPDYYTSDSQPWECPVNPVDAQHCAPGFAPRRDQYSTPYVDGAGRLTCDPLGLSEREQMQNYMAEIMGSNTIVLVPALQRFIDRFTGS